MINKTDCTLVLLNWTKTWKLLWVCGLVMYPSLCEANCVLGEGWPFVPPCGGTFSAIHMLSLVTCPPGLGLPYGPVPVTVRSACHRLYTITDWDVCFVYVYILDTGQRSFWDPCRLNGSLLGDDSITAFIIMGLLQHGLQNNQVQMVFVFNVNTP